MIAYDKKYLLVITNLRDIMTRKKNYLKHLIANYNIVKKLVKFRKQIPLIPILPKTNCELIDHSFLEI